MAKIVNEPAQIERARPMDGDAVLQLLKTNGLPIDGLLEHLATTLVARQGGRIVGSAALEMYPDGALLRSVAVAPDVRRHGLGRRLTDAAIQLAREQQSAAIYLLTTTAEEFFPRFGFARVARTDVPPGVRTSVEFTSACPSNATVMRKPLDPAPATLPIVCTLLPGQLNARAMELLPGLVSRARAVAARDAGYRLEFAATSDLLRAIADAIDAERQCCRFLRFDLIVEPDERGIVLEISGPPGTKEFLDGLGPLNAST